MKKLILAGAVLAIALMASVTMGADMVAGNPKNGANVVGTVDVSDDGTDLTVVYTITDPNWVITETHLHVGTAPSDFPKWPKDPAPGQFDYSDSNDVTEGVTTVTYIIPLADIPADPGQTLYIAAHAVVVTLCPCEDYDLNLPDLVDLIVLHAGDVGATGNSYFDAIVSGGTDLDGLHAANCVDTDRGVRPPGHYVRGVPLMAEVYSSLDCGLLPVLDPVLVEDCGDMDLVNWILNNVAVGDASGCGGTYTYGDIQRVIWELLNDDTTEDSGLGDWSQCRVDEIIALAQAEGEGFEPICGELVGVILLPYVWLDLSGNLIVIPGTEDPPSHVGFPEYDENELPPEIDRTLEYLQPIIIMIPVPCCYCDETAWAGTPLLPEETNNDWPDEDSDGYKYEFPGKNWAMYFTYPEDAVLD